MPPEDAVNLGNCVQDGFPWFRAAAIGHPAQEKLRANGSGKQGPPKAGSPGLPQPLLQAGGGSLCIPGGRACSSECPWSSGHVQSERVHSCPLAWRPPGPCAAPVLPTHLLLPFPNHQGSDPALWGGHLPLAPAPSPLPASSTPGPASGYCLCVLSPLPSSNQSGPGSLTATLASCCVCGQGQSSRGGCCLAE